MEDLIVQPNLYDLLIAAATFVLGLLSLVLYKGADWLGAKSQNELLRRALLGLRTAVATAVRDVWQEYVGAIKTARADGKLTADEKRIAKQMAVAKAKSYLGKPGIALLLKVFGVNEKQLEPWLGDHVEAALHDAKLEAQALGGAKASPLPSSAPA